MKNEEKTWKRQTWTEERDIDELKKKGLSKEEWTKMRQLRESKNEEK
jgi:hypothetical protein